LAGTGLGEVPDVWDGSQRHQDGKKSISHTLKQGFLFLDQRFTHVPIGFGQVNSAAEV